MKIYYIRNMKKKEATFVITQLGKNDTALANKLIALFAEVFEEKKTAPTKNDHLYNLLNNPAFIALVALDDNKVIGGITAYELPMLAKAKSEIFIYDVAIKTEYQRKGIGRKLITALLALAKEKGVSEVFVAAHTEDTHALKFYQSLGGKAEKVNMFVFEGVSANK
jgi:aminoglycoside 3-N-acetyltransferase I